MEKGIQGSQSLSLSELVELKLNIGITNADALINAMKKVATNFGESLWQPFCLALIPASEFVVDSFSQLSLILHFPKTVRLLIH